METVTIGRKRLRFDRLSVTQKSAGTKDILVDLKRIDFSPETGGSQYFPLDKNKPQDIEDMTPHEQ